MGIAKVNICQPCSMFAIMIIRIPRIGGGDDNLFDMLGIVEIRKCQKAQIELGDLGEHFFLYLFPGRPW